MMKEKPDSGTSVILPTIHPVDAINDISNQLEDNDELIVVCDNERNPVAEIDFGSKSQVRLIEAGEPESCSGKANAIAAGMKAAENQWIAWTDDDFEHKDDWLKTLKQGCEEYGAASELPFHISKNKLGCLSESVLAAAMLATYLDNQCWGGSLIFDRNLLDEEEFLDDLTSTISDDVLLGEYLDFKTIRSFREVRVDSNFEETVERGVRFLQIVRNHRPTETLLLTFVSFIIAFLLISNPLLGFIITNLAFLGVYMFFNKLRPTFVLSYLSLIVLPFFTLYSLNRSKFEWAGRKYKFNSKLDVEVVGD